MNKLYLKTLLLCLFSFVGMAKAFAHNIEVANADGVTIYYNYINNQTELEVTYCGYSYFNEDYSGNVVIPETVTFDGKSYSVTKIGGFAFYECSGLTAVTIPNSVTSIDTYAFCLCTSLTSVTIPNSVTSIGNTAFHGCTSLTSVNIPKSVTSIMESAFNYCSNLERITIEEGNPSYDSRENCNAIIRTEDNVLITGCKNTVIPNSVKSIGEDAFSSCNGLTSINIPEGVISIGNNAFSGCFDLASVNIPNSVTEIGHYAFNACIGLTSINIPKSVTSIGGNNPFETCYSLERITVEDGNPSYDSRENCNAIIRTEDNTLITGCKNTHIPSSVESIGFNAFFNCIDLASINIPSSVTTIERYAFGYCSNLTTLNISNGVKYIGGYAFEECKSLTSVNIPSSVDSIGKNVFVWCSNLERITVDADNPSYDSRENCNAIISTDDNTLIVGCKNTLIPNSVTSIGEYAFFGSGLTSMDIPDNVTSIDFFAFGYCNNLTSVHIPNGVTMICGSMFQNCSSLTSVNIPNGVTFIGSDVFNGCTSLTHITIPSSVKSMEEAIFKNCDNLRTIISEIREPLKIFNNTFSQYTYENGTLYVPEGTAEKYKEAAVWKNFANIVDGIPASIAPTNNSTDEATEVERYTIDGRRISAPQRGINVVRMSDGTMKKVLVK